MIDWTADWLDARRRKPWQADALRGARWPLLTAARLPILRLQPDDAESVWPLSVEAGWNQIAADWRLMIGSGSRASASGMRRAGGSPRAGPAARPRRSSWISMVLVTEPERGKGHGSRLLRRCIADHRGRPARAMGLDATEFGRPIYLPLGFRDVYPLSRWSAPRRIRSMRCCSGRDRDQADPPARPCDDRQLRPPAQRASSAARCWRICLSARPERRTRGRARRWQRRRLQPRPRRASCDPYRADRRRRPGHRPGTAEPVRWRSSRGPAILDVPDQHETIRQWLQSLGASAPRTFMRMLRGAAPAVEDGSRIMALAGPELA